MNTINLIPKSEYRHLEANDSNSPEVKELLSQQAEEFHKQVNTFIGSLDSTITDPDLKFGEKIDRLLALTISLVPIVLVELEPNKILINSDRSEQAMKVLSMVKGVEASLYKKRETEAKEEVDVSHPKFQKTLDWLMEGVLLSLEQTGVDEHQRANFIHNFAQRMVNFESEANKKLRGTSFQNLDTLDNPLIRKFNDLRR